MARPSHELADTAWQHVQRFERSGDVDELRAARRLYLAAIRCSTGYLRAGYQVELSGVLDALGDLPSAIAAAWDGVSAVEPGHSDFELFVFAYLRLLARTNPASLANTSQVVRRLVDGVALNSGLRLEVVALAWICHHIDFEVTRSIPALDNAVKAAEELACAAYDHEQERLLPLCQLVAVLHIRFEHQREDGDLDRAVEAARTALKLTWDGHEDSAMVLHQLASALVQRFEHLGDPADLDEGVPLARRAVALPGTADSDAFMLCAGLARALTTRYDVTRSLTDLNDAIDFNERARRFPGLDAREHGMVLIGLINTYLDRFERQSNQEDGESAVRLAQDACSLLNGHLELPQALHAAGNAAFTLATAQAARSDARTQGIARAVDLFAQADRACLDGHVRLAAILSSLCQALTVQGTDLDAAVAAGRRTVERSSERQRAAAQTLLARALCARSADGDVEEAIANVEEAAANQIAPTRDRLHAARELAELVARSGLDHALSAYSAAVGLLPRLAVRGGHLADNERLMGGWHGLASDAAACAVESKDLDRAVEVLEQGRGVLWSAVLEPRGDLTRLRTVAPDLAAELERLGLLLESAGSRDRDDLLALNVRWNEVVANVRRTVPEFDTFMCARQISDLLPSEQDTVVVIVNVSQHRSDALLVSPSGVSVEPLSHVNLAKVVERAEVYLAGMRLGGNVFDKILVDVLRWLWEAIASPVLDRLGADGAEPRRICWCPTGPLTLMPLHAAGGVPDLTISSYTPTLTALNTVDRRARPSRSVLAVSMPKTPDLSDLPSAAVETSRLRERYREHAKVLEGAEATPDAVRIELKDHVWAHFACHARQDLADPAASGLILHGGEVAAVLTVADLAMERYDHEFAYLSACETAVGGLGNLDEAISLVSALRYTGWEHVIGSLWSVRDDLSAEIAELVYGELDGQGEPDFAAALRNAVLLKRDEGHTLRAWAPYVHYGL